MIYNIHGFQHKKLLEFGLDNDDALILRAITGMYASPKMEHTTIDGLRYIWVNQSYLQRQVEIVGSKRTVMRRINRMIEKEILLSHTLYSKKGVKGTYYYIAPTEKLDKLRDIEPYDNMAKGQAKPYDKMSKGGRTKCYTKDTINNIDTNNNTIYTDDPLTKIFNTWVEADIIKHKRLTKVMENKIKSALKDYTVDEIVQAIKNYGYIVNDDRYFFNYKWTLDQFCTISQKDRIASFLDLEAAKSNYRDRSKIEQSRPSNVKVENNSIDEAELLRQQAEEVWQ